MLYKFCISNNNISNEILQWLTYHLIYSISDNNASSLADHKFENNEKKSFL